ncbi:MAG TPA: glycosyltransferase family 25 protein [Accumulibacter sp.]|nr:glycosyltransferase family 25 protein [Accumulibacter sp.]
MMAAMPIYVVNLPAAVRRRERMQTHLAELGLPDSRIFPGVLGSDLSEQALAERYDDAGARAASGRAFTRGEVGCALSHLAIYREMCRLNQPFSLIFEDDCTVHPDLPALLPAIGRWLAAGTPRVLLLSPLRGYLGRGATPLDARHRIVRIHRAWGAYGYCLNQAAARALLEVNSPVILAADDWIRYRQRTAIDLCGLDPYRVLPNELGAASHISIDRDALQSQTSTAVGDRLRRLARRWRRAVIEKLWLRPVHQLRRHRHQPFD